MQIETQLWATDLHRVAETVQRYERLGFDGVSTFENTHDPYLLMTIAAQATSTIRVGTNVAIALARGPFSTAMAAWDVQSLSHGRFRLGLGTQVREHVERRFGMPFDRPAARIKDYVRCVRAIWASFQHGAPADYRGEFYRFDMLPPAFNPGPLPYADIPISLAGVNPAMCKAAGEVADGFHVHSFHTPDYLKHVVLAKLDEGARTRHKTVQDLVISAPVYTVSSDSQAEMDRQLELVRGKIAFYATWRNYHAVLAYHGFEGVGEELTRMAARGEWEAMPAKISDAVVDLMAVVAPPGQLAAKLQVRYQGLLDSVSLYTPPSPGDADAVWQSFVASFRAAEARPPRPA